MCPINRIIIDSADCVEFFACDVCAVGRLYCAFLECVLKSALQVNATEFLVLFHYIDYLR